MASNLSVFRRCSLYRHSHYLHHQRQFHRLAQPKYIHPNSFLYNAYRRPINRQFATKPGKGDGLPGKPQPNYILRILFVTSILGGGVAYYFGWTDDIISFAQQRFAYLEIFNRDKDKTSTGSAYKLPKPKKKQSDSSEVSTKPKIKPKPKPLPKPTPSVIDKPKTPSPPKPKPKPSPPPAPKVEPKPEPKEIEKPKLPAPVQEVIEVIKEETQEISQEILERYEKLKKEVIELTSDKDIADDEETAKPKQEEKQSEDRYATDSDRYMAEIVALKKLLDQKTLRVEELERDLNEKSEFIVDNLKKLEEGRNAYDEVTQIFEEMRTEYQEQMIQQMEHMEDERKKRLNKLTEFSVDIRVLEKIMAWYDVNNKFFLDLAELNNVVYRFEDKLNHGLSYDAELNYLLKNLPKNFISFQLISNLNEAQKKNKTFHINSQQQLYDRFCILENALRQTAMTPKSTDSLWGNLLAKLFSSVLMKEQISRSGTGLNDRISRAGYSMKCGDLESALDELNYLDEDILYPAQDWLKSARQRLLGLSAIKILKSELLSRSIKMVNNDE